MYVSLSTFSRYGYLMTDSPRVSRHLPEPRRPGVAELGGSQRAAGLAGLDLAPRVISDCHPSEGELKANRTYGLSVSEFYF
jgi:hypothetical protein